MILFALGLSQTSSRSMIANNFTEELKGLFYLESPTKESIPRQYQHFWMETWKGKKIIVSFRLGYLFFVIRHKYISIVRNRSKLSPVHLVMNSALWTLLLIWKRHSITSFACLGFQPMDHICFGGYTVYAGTLCWYSIPRHRQNQEGIFAWEFYLLVSLILYLVKVAWGFPNHLWQGYNRKMHKLC